MSDNFLGKTGQGTDGLHDSSGTYVADPNVVRETLRSGVANYFRVLIIAKQIKVNQQNDWIAGGCQN